MEACKHGMCRREIVPPAFPSTESAAGVVTLLLICVFAGASPAFCEAEASPHYNGAPLLHTEVSWRGADSLSLHTGAPLLDTKASQVVLASDTVDCNEARLAVELPGGLEPEKIAVPLEHSLVQSPLAAPPELGPAFSIGGITTYTPYDIDEREPAIAFDGTNYLVVWETTSDILGVRVTPSGTVLDADPIPVSQAASKQFDADVAFDGTNYLVVWVDNRSGNYDIYAARVTTAGEILDSCGFVVCALSSGQEWPAVAFDGTDYLVAWSDYRNVNWDVYGARVAPSGVVLDPGGVPISTTSGSQRYPAIAFCGGNYLVAWQDTRAGGKYQVYGARVSTAGAVLDPGGIPIAQTSGDKYWIDIASDGVNYFVVWEDYRSGTSWDVYGARVDAAGTVLEPDGFAISARSSHEWGPTVAFDGTNYMVAWPDGRINFSDIFASRVSTGGAVLDPDGIAISSLVVTQSWPALAFDDTNYFLVWQDMRSGSDYDIYGTPLTPEGISIVPDGAVMAAELGYRAVSAADQNYSAVASDGTDYLTVWMDPRPAAWEIYGAKVTSAGAVGESVMPISTAANEQSYPALAFGGGQYFTVWQDRRSGVAYDIYGARVSAVGTVIDPSGIAISLAADEQYWPAVAFDGTNYLVVWQDKRAGAAYDIYGARVSASGVVLDPEGFVISSAVGDQYWPAVAFDGANYLVVWADARSDADWDIYGARVSPSANVLESDGIPISTAEGSQFLPAVAFGWTSYMVVWADKRIGYWDIYASRVSPDGVVFDPQGLAVSTEVNDQYWPAIAFDKTKYMVVWQDNRDGTQYWDICGTQLAHSGVVVYPEGFRISTGFCLEKYPAVASGAPSSLLITYQNLEQSGICGTYIIWGNIWTGPPTSVVFSSVSASGRGGRVVLSWELFAPVPASSLFVLRSESLDGEYASLDAPVGRGHGATYSCTDYQVTPGRTYYYKIGLLGTAADDAYGPVEVYVESPGVVLIVQRSFPNPFNPACTIHVELLKPCRFTVRIFDASGGLVRTLADGARESGAYAETWNGRDDGGRDLPSGVYLCRVEADELSVARKIVLLR
ncbi:MAG: FlgD immunoglobulin-like domain containing protein [Candidatus Eisenbacteria bacterium]